MSKALTQTGALCAQVESGSAAYDWASTEKHLGRLQKLRQSLEGKLTTREKDMMPLATAEFKKQFTVVALLSHIESFCRHDTEVEGMQMMTDRMLKHHRLEASS